jgi:hypothetical protein
VNRLIIRLPRIGLYMLRMSGRVTLGCSYNTIYYSLGLITSSKKGDTDIYI